MAWRGAAGRTGGARLGGRRVGGPGPDPPYRPARAPGHGSAGPTVEPLGGIDGGGLGPVGRRRALPSGRTVVGGFLVAVAAVIVFAAALAGTGHRGRPYLVAARDLAAGSVIGPGDLVTQDVTLPPAVRAHAFTGSLSLVGRTLAVPIGAGALVQDSMLDAPSAAPALRPVGAQVDPTGLDALAPGRRVDVLETVGSGTGSSVQVVLRGATLLAVARGSSSVLAGPSTSTEVTLGVATLSEVEAVVQASHAGTVALVAAEPSDGSGPGP